MNMKILNFSVPSRYYIYIAKYTILMFLSHLPPTKQVVVFALLFVLLACFSKITVSWITVLKVRLALHVSIDLCPHILVPLGTYFIFLCITCQAVF